MEDGLKTAPDLARYKRMVTQFLDLTQDARNRSLNDIRYYHSKQYTTEELETLRARRQPDSIFNHIKVGVNGTLGVLKQGETDPRAYPRNPNDEQSADVATKVLRYIADYNGFDDLRIAVARDYLTPGTGAAVIEVDGDNRVTVEQIRWEEFIYDPRSRREDFKDASYLGIAKWMFADDVKAMYPDKKEAIEASVTDGPLVIDEVMDDRPRDGRQSWIDRRQRRIMVVDLYHREGGTWNRCVFFAGEVLEAGPSAYLDDKKKPVCPIEAQSCFVDDENVRYGIVYDMRGPQDEINKRRSKLLHLLNNRQVTASAPEYAGEFSADTVRDEAARPDGVLPPGWEPVALTDMTAGQFQLLAEAKGEIERMGPNPAILGRQGENQSGRANLVRQQAGLTEQAVIFGGIESWELRVYRQMWNRAKQYWTAPDYVRVTDDLGALEFIGINQPIPGPPQVVMGPQGVPTIQPSVLGYENALAEMDVDITLDTVPDVANLQQEQFQMLSELAKLYGPQEVPFDDILELSAIPDKAKIIEKRRERAEQNQANPMQEIQMRGAMAEVGKTEAEIVKIQAEAEKIGAETAETQVDTRNALVAPTMDAFKTGLSAGSQNDRKAS